MKESGIEENAERQKKIQRQLIDLLYLTAETTEDQKLRHQWLAQLFYKLIDNQDPLGPAAPNSTEIYPIRLIQFLLEALYLLDHQDFQNSLYDFVSLPPDESATTGAGCGNTARPTPASHAPSPAHRDDLEIDPETLAAILAIQAAERLEYEGAREAATRTGSPAGVEESKGDDDSDLAQPAFASTPFRKMPEPLNVTTHRSNGTHYPAHR